MTTSSGSRNHVPVRMCIGCRQRENKPKLIRIVNDGKKIVIDLKHNLSGRGAYIHIDKTCLENLIKKNSLNRAFKQKVPDEFYKELEKLITTEIPEDQKPTNPTI